jgi:GNAT superfamily N-acetyltransferase
MLPNGFLIRLALEEDLPRILELERLSGERFKPYGLKNRVEVLTPKELLLTGICNQRCWVVTIKNDCPVGFALVSTVGKFAHLDELDVLPAYGCKGLGSALLDVVDNWACINGLKTIVLTTFSHIPWNAPFYAKQGFKVLNPEKFSEEVKQILKEETARGVPTEKRVVMHKNL